MLGRGHRAQLFEKEHLGRRPAHVRKCDIHVIADEERNDPNVAVELIRGVDDLGVVAGRARRQ